MATSTEEINTVSTNIIGVNLLEIALKRLISSLFMDIKPKQFIIAKIVLLYKDQ